MDSHNYRPQSPDLSSYAPQSPDLSAFHHPQSPDLSALEPQPPFLTSHYAGVAGGGVDDGGASYTAPLPSSHPSFGLGVYHHHQQHQQPAMRFHGTFGIGGLGGAGPAGAFGSNGFGAGAYSHPPPHHHQPPPPQQQHRPTSVPAAPQATAGYNSLQGSPFDASNPMPPQHQQLHHSQTPTYMKREDDGYDPEWSTASAAAAHGPHGPNKRTRRNQSGPQQQQQQQEQQQQQQQPPYQTQDPFSSGGAGGADRRPHLLPDPALGCTLKTQFPVARIKRLMQADEDIGKVAQVTPTVVSRALELFMIRLISAAADQARSVGRTSSRRLSQSGGGGTGQGEEGGDGTLGRGAGNGAGVSSRAAATPAKGSKRILVQHLKQAVLAEDKFDFLHEIVGRVPDAPTKGSGAGKKENTGSDSEDAPAAASHHSSSSKVGRKKGKRRKDSGDDF